MRFLQNDANQACDGKLKWNCKHWIECMNICINALLARKSLISNSVPYSRRLLRRRKWRCTFVCYFLVDTLAATACTNFSLCGLSKKCDTYVKVQPRNFGSGNGNQELCKHDNRDLSRLWTLTRTLFVFAVSRKHPTTRFALPNLIWTKKTWRKRKCFPITEVGLTSSETVRSTSRTRGQNSKENVRRRWYDDEIIS